MNNYDPDQLRRWMKTFVSKLELGPNPQAVEMTHVLDAMRYALEDSMFKADELLVSPKTFNGLKNLLDGWDNKKK